MGNSHWLKGNKSVITLTMADYNCIQVHFTAYSSCHHWHMPLFIMEGLFLYRILLEKFECFFTQRSADGSCCSSSSIERHWLTWGNWCINSMQRQKKCRCANVETNKRDGRALHSFYCFVNKGCRRFIKGRAPGKLTGCEQDLAINLPGCFRLLFLLFFIRKTKMPGWSTPLTSCTKT